MDDIVALRTPRPWSWTCSLPFAVLQTVSEVLTDCGSDIDAAIKRLGQLQLRAEGRSDPAAAEQANGSAAAAAAAASPRGSPLGENLFLASPWD